MHTHADSSQMCKRECKPGLDLSSIKTFKLLLQTCPRKKAIFKSSAHASSAGFIFF